MECQACKKAEATVHLTRVFKAPGYGGEPGTQQQQRFCESCADAYFATTPGMNSLRGLICLSDSYRSKLYDLLEANHPEFFGNEQGDNEDPETSRRRSQFEQDFLREQLKKGNVEVNEDAFGMLFADLFCSHHFYTRRDEYRRRRR
jgi:hypothetical protein